MLSKIRKILGVLTDVLKKGRDLGLWSKGRGPNIPGPKQ